MRRNRKEDPYLFDDKLRIEHSVSSLIGVDEAGRGPLAGPVVVAAAMLDSKCPIDGLDDSKKLSSEKRDELYKRISEHPHHIIVVSVDIIERINILGATMSGMRSVVSLFNDTMWGNSKVIVDGNIKIPHIPEDKQIAIIKADAKSACVAAASILAKVTRDRIMGQIAENYPGYGFDKNKGYGSPEHIKAIRSLGLSPVHRPSFCRKFLESSPATYNIF